MAFSVTCPHCHAVLKTAEPVPAGKKVRCPKCERAFQAPSLEEAEVRVTPVVAPTRKLRDEPAAMEAEARPIDDEAPVEDDVPRRRDDHDDRDDDGADEARAERKRKPKKGGMSTGTLAGILVAGGLMLIVACSGCGGLGYWLYTIYGTSPIVGTWEQTNNPLGLRPTNTFQSDGRGHLKMGNVQVSYKYTLTGNTLVLEPDQVQGVFVQGNVVERYTVVFQGNEMVLTSLDNRPFVLREQRYRRIQ